MNQLRDSEKIPFYVVERDLKSNPVKDDGDSATVTVDVAASATVALDAAVDPAKIPNGPDGKPEVDPALVLATGFLVGGSTVGPFNVTTSFAHTDGSEPPADVVSPFTLLSGAPSSGAISFGAPIAQ